MVRSPQKLLILIIKNPYPPDQSIPKTFNSILKTKSLVISQRRSSATAATTHWKQLTDLNTKYNCCRIIIQKNLLCEVVIKNCQGNLSDTSAELCVLISTNIADFVLAHTSVRTPQKVLTVIYPDYCARGLSSCHNRAWRPFGSISAPSVDGCTI